MGSNGFSMFIPSKAEVDVFLHVSSRNSDLPVNQNFLGLSNEMGLEDNDKKWPPELCAFGRTLYFRRLLCKQTGQ